MPPTGGAEPRFQLSMVELVSLNVGLRRCCEIIRSQGKLEYLMYFIRSRLGHISSTVVKAKPGPNKLLQWEENSERPAYSDFLGPD